ncbi:S-adenosyl-L-methionine-dependent methyltransferase [Lineolata rhizophorae]|uniref:catechol O-methyltransferase n=1 Tax=Lineolata rhizophorae TaxID=578093 RepID=A0A6A6NTN8_9PEZI|nr:S-adenosyl-L-methionine-dependent methyltransferase [Lineolata rhizophorae]
MATFDKSKAYQDQDQVFFDDGREVELLHFVFGRPDIDSIRGNPTAVVKAIDEYGRTKKYLMNVGEDKGAIVSNLIAEVKPRIMVELGGYVGYSAILFGAAVRKANPQGKYYSLERNPEFAAVSGALVNLAGLSDTVKIEVGSSDASLKRLYEAGAFGDQIDLMFLDHWKPAYTTDLKLCEELRLVRPGSVLAADNVIKPGNPPYLEYVRSSVGEKRKAVAEQKKNGSGVDERFSSKQATMYEKRVGKVELANLVGNPNLIYESKLIESFEPSGVADGVEITRCMGEESQ